MRLFILTFCFLSLSAFAQSNFERLNYVGDVSRLLFGSCNDQTKYQPLWNTMRGQNADLFIWGGDAVYVDSDPNGDAKASYEMQNKNQDYLNFKASLPYIGVWDDHDYGWNNANGYLPQKKENQKLFLDFIEEPSWSRRRSQEGVYTSYEFGSYGQRVKVILLDNRYFKDLDQNAPMLGEKQWKWLERELKNSDTKINFIMAGLSISAPYIPLTDGTWANYPGEVRRLTGLIEEHKTKGVVFLTGDLHFSSIFRRLGYLEFMSSGLTEVAPRPSWILLGRLFETSFFGQNYGQIDIAWEQQQNPVLTVSVRNEDGDAFHLRKFRWSEQEVDWIEIF